MSEQKDTEKYVGMGTKVSPDKAAIINAICDALGTDVYHLLQQFLDTLIHASNEHTELSPEVRKIMTLMERDAGWQDAISICNPDGLEVAQIIMVLEQKDHKGFDAVMINKPFMGKATQTWCYDDIIERVIEVCLHGLYRRLRELGAQMGCDHLIDILMTMVDTQTLLETERENRREMQGEAMFDDRGRPIAYGKRTKTYQHRTPDGEAARQQRIIFDDFDRDSAKAEVQEWEGEVSNRDPDPDFRPIGEEW